MNKKTTQMLCFFAAACFAFVGITNRNVAYLSLAVAYICIGATSNRKKPPETKEDSGDSEDNQKRTFHK